MVGPRQARILDLLTAGPHSINALINRTDPWEPQGVLGSIRALVRRGLIEVRGSFDPTSMVALAPLPTDDADPMP